MAVTVATLAGEVLCEVSLADTAQGLVADLPARLPPASGAATLPRFLLGPRELGWSECLADLGLRPGDVISVVRVQDPEKVAADLLGAEDARLRLAAARTLGAMGPAAAGQAGALLEAVGDPNADVADAANKALQNLLGAVRSLAGEVVWLPSEVCEIVRLVRIAQLAKKVLAADKQAFWALTPQLRQLSVVDGELLARPLAVVLESARKSGDKNATKRLTFALGALRLMHWRGNHRIGGLVAGALRDPDEAVRASAVQTLSCMKREFGRVERHLGELCDMLQGDADSEVRIEVATALGSVGPEAAEAARRALHGALADDAPVKLTRAIAQALEELGEGGDVPPATGGGAAVVAAETPGGAKVAEGPAPAAGRSWADVARRQGEEGATPAGGRSWADMARRGGRGGGGPAAAPAPRGAWSR